MNYVIKKGDVVKRVEKQSDIFKELIENFDKRESIEKIGDLYLVKYKGKEFVFFNNEVMEVI